MFKESGAASTKRDLSSVHVKKLSIVIGLFGRFTINQNFLPQVQSYLLEALANRDALDGVQFVVVHAGDQWTTLPTLQNLSVIFPDVKILESDPSSSPAALFNSGLNVADGARIIFLSPDASLSKVVLGKLIDACFDAAGSETALAVYDLSIGHKLKLPGEPPKALLHGWLLNSEIFRLSHVAVPSSIVRKLNGFDCSPLLQMSAGWDFLVRLTKECELKIIPLELSEPRTQDMAADFPAPYPVSLDLRRRYLARTMSPEREKKFLADLPAADGEYLARHIKSFSRQPGSAARPLKITVTGSYWEYHHNWLCFFNYFNHLEGSGFGTFKSLFDHLVSRADIEDSDIVILSRCKVDEVRNIIDWCRDLKIPTVYMIDDNWLTVANDWPVYESIFGPDTPFFRNFMFGIKNADYVLTYNRLLADDVGEYAKRVIMLPNSVDLNAFEQYPRKETDRFVVGYSGSTRYANGPFEALAAVAQQRSDVDIFVFGSVTPEQEKILSKSNVTYYPLVSYDSYRKAIREISPDILLAPLDSSRTSRSKCPNKYLEATAAGAVGIYSDIEPYNRCVTSGVNGLLISDERKWRDAINQLLNKKLLRKMQAAARCDVATNFDARRVADQFADLMNSIASGEL